MTSQKTKTDLAIIAPDTDKSGPVENPHKIYVNEPNFVVCFLNNALSSNVASNYFFTNISKLKSSGN